VFPCGFQLSGQRFLLFSIFRVYFSPPYLSVTSVCCTPNSQANFSFYWGGSPILSGTKSSGGGEYINFTPDVSGQASIFVQLITQGADLPISYEGSVYYVDTGPE